MHHCACIMSCPWSYLSAESTPWQVPPHSVVMAVSSDEGKDLTPLRRCDEAMWPS